ncbi:MAG: lipoyl synthase [Deltaproteobacteria bacterium]|nr:lipoyl synthase [Deltaproteobacteria bacterium]
MPLPVLPDDAPSRHNRPPWLRVKAPQGDVYETVRRLKDGLRLHTVCESAACPNLGECWGRGTATFMINGNQCTRACRFCDVQSGRPGPIDPDEADRVAEATARLGLRFAVITAVTRDDLEDGGASAFARVLRALAARAPACGREVLIPDFNGSERDLRTVLDAQPHVLAHNVETVRRLTPEIRSGARYELSLQVLQAAHRLRPDILSKSGIMLGLGEREPEIDETLRDLRTHDVEAITIGQYLQPSAWHRPIDRWVTPDEFAAWDARARALGFRLVASGPLVRSSYHAEAAAGLVSPVARGA